MTLPAQVARWRTDQWTVDVNISNEEPRDDWFFAGIEGITGPVHWELNDFGNWELIFRNRNPRLPEYLSARRDENLVELATRLINAAFPLFERIHRHQHCVGDLDFRALACAEHGGLLSLELLQTRPLLPFGKGKGGGLPEVVGIDAPEVRNGKSEDWSAATDVFVLGAFFVALLTGREHFTDFEELSYIAHQLLNFVPDYPASFHPWLARSLPLDPAQRFKSISEQAAAFHTAIEQWGQRRASFGGCLTFSAHGKSEEGTGKLTDADDERPDSEVNQDRFKTLVMEETPPRAFMFVADGISTARFGTGGQAAEMVCQALVGAWDANTLIDSASLVATLQSASESVFRSALEQSQATKQGSEREPGGSDFMGASVTAAIVAQNTATIAAAGDTRAYLWSAEGGLWLLTNDHHVLNERLVAGALWSDARDNDDAESLSRSVGAAKKEDSAWHSQKLIPMSRTIALRPGDILMICSDGLVNYLSPAATGRGRWEAEARLAQFLAENPGKGIRKTINCLVSLANQNGGGDNITLTMLRCTEAARAESPKIRPVDTPEPRPVRDSPKNFNSH